MTQLFNLGSSLLALTQKILVFDERASYVRGVLTRSAEAPYYIQGLFTPESRSQVFAKEADRVVKQAELITKNFLWLNRKDNYRTVITYENEQYKIIERSDWLDFGYYSYILELIIPNEG